MKLQFMTHAAVTALFVLAGCDQPQSVAQTGPKPAASATTTTEQSTTLTPAMLTGRWGDNGDCTGHG